MTTDVHEDYPYLEELLADGYVVIGKRYYFPDDRPKFMRLELVAADLTCLHKMRPWKQYDPQGRVVREQLGYCTLDRGHLMARHSTSTFYCDACGKTRINPPAHADEDVCICFLCMRKQTDYAYGMEP